MGSITTIHKLSSREKFVESKNLGRAGIRTWCHWVRSPNAKLLLCYAAAPHVSKVIQKFWPSTFVCRVKIASRAAKFSNPIYMKSVECSCCPGERANVGSFGFVYFLSHAVPLTNRLLRFLAEKRFWFEYVRDCSWRKNPLAIWILTHNFPPKSCCHCHFHLLVVDLLLSNQAGPKLAATTLGAHAAVTNKQLCLHIQIFIPPA